MIIKFCFNNEIHRCTKPPTNFSALEPFLKSMFHSGLPTEIGLYYNDSNNEKIFLESQETYDNMMYLCPKTTVKVFITHREVEKKPVEDLFDSEVIEDEDKKDVLKNDDYEVIKRPKIKIEDINKDTEIIDKVVERKPEEKGGSIEEIDDMIASTAESRVYETILSMGDIQLENGDNLKQLIHDTLKQEIPSVVTEVKQELSRRGSVDLGTPVREIPKMEPAIEKKENKDKEKKKDGFIEEIKEFGREISDSFKDFPEAFVDMIDDISCLIMGDPKYFYAGDRFTKSVIAKTEQLKKLFPETNLRSLADFVNSMPKNFTFEEVVNAYLKTVIADELRRQAVVSAKV